jgi:hypothetical protein
VKKSFGTRSRGERGERLGGATPEIPATGLSATVPGFRLRDFEIQVADKAAHGLTAAARGLGKAAMLQPVAIARLAATLPPRRKSPHGGKQRCGLRCHSGVSGSRRANAGILKVPIRTSGNREGYPVLSPLRQACPPPFFIPARRDMDAALAVDEECAVGKLLRPVVIAALVLLEFLVQRPIVFFDDKRGTFSFCRCHLFAPHIDVVLEFAAPHRGDAVTQLGADLQQRYGIRIGAAAGVTEFVPLGIYGAGIGEKRGDGVRHILQIRFQRCDSG